MKTTVQQLPYHAFAFSRNSAIVLLQNARCGSTAELTRLTNPELTERLRGIEGLIFSQCSGVFNSIPQDSLDADILIEKTKHSYCLNAYYRVTLGFATDVIEHSWVYYDTVRNR